MDRDASLSGGYVHSVPRLDVTSRLHRQAAETAIALLRHQTRSRKRAMHVNISNAPPSGAAMRRPHEWFFSTAITKPNTSIQPRFSHPDKEHHEHKCPAAP